MSKKSFIVILLGFALLFSTVACGNNAKDSSDRQAASQQETTQPVQASPDPGASADNFIGNWIDVNSPDRFANITKTDTGYQYEDNDGKYPATFQDRALKIQVSDTDTAEVHLNATTGHIILEYQNSQSEYKKKGN